MKKRNLILFGLIISIVFISIVYAGAFSSSVTPNSINEDTSYTYNFTIDNVLGEQNLTRVEIVFPDSAGFSFVAGSKGTSAINASFSSTPSALTWNNATSESLVLNEIKYFWFNASAANPGNYNFAINVKDTAGVVNTTNLAIAINDTSAPVISFATPIDGANLSQNYLIFNLSASDYSGVDTLILRVYHSNSSLLSATSVNSAELPLYLGLSNLTDGVYYYNVSVNDTRNYLGGSVTRNVRLDAAAPVIDSLVFTDVSNSAVSIGVSINESGSGIISSCTSTRGSGSGTGNSQTISASGLSCDTAYDFTITCTDAAGNSASKSGTHTTSACDSDPDSSSESETTQTTQTSFWTDTYLPTDAQISEGYNKTLEKGERIRVKINAKSYYVGIVKLTSSIATINISLASAPQQAVFNAGETKLFEVTNDSYYDIKIKVDSVNSSASDLIVWAIHEKIGGTSDTAGNNASAGTTGITGGTINEEENETSARVSITGLITSVGDSAKSLAKNKGFWIGFGIVVIGSAGTIYYLRTRKRLKKMGFI